MNGKEMHFNPMKGIPDLCGFNDSFLPSFLLDSRSLVFMMGIGRSNARRENWNWKQPRTK